jgi:hypothetical protein
MCAVDANVITTRLDVLIESRRGNLISLDTLVRGSMQNIQGFIDSADLYEADQHRLARAAERRNRPQRQQRVERHRADAFLWLAWYITGFATIWLLR